MPKTKSAAPKTVWLSVVKEGYNPRRDKRRPQSTLGFGWVTQQAGGS